MPTPAKMLAEKEQRLHVGERRQHPLQERAARAPGFERADSIVAAVARPSPRQAAAHQTRADPDEIGAAQHDRRRAAPTARRPAAGRARAASPARRTRSPAGCRRARRATSRHPAVSARCTISSEFGPGVGTIASHSSVNAAQQRVVELQRRSLLLPAPASGRAPDRSKRACCGSLGGPRRGRQSAVARMRLRCAARGRRRELSAWRHGAARTAKRRLVGWKLDIRYSI